MSDWIKFDDELPQDKQIVKIKGNFPFETEATFIKTEKGYFLRSRIDNEIGLIFEFYGATHWMPLKENSNE